MAWRCPVCSRPTPARQRIPIVLFTAHAMKGDGAHMRQAGCDGYIAKPIDVDQLAAQVRAQL